MDLDKEIMRRLKVEVAALEAAMKQKDNRISQLEEEHKMLVAAVLKYGTKVSRNTMELTVSEHNLTPHTIYAYDDPLNHGHIVRLRWT